MSTPQEIMQKPWPRQPEERYYSNDTPAEKRSQAIAYNEAVRATVRAEREQLRSEKRAVCPKFTLLLPESAELPLTEDGMRFTATLRYDAKPTQQQNDPELPIVAHILHDYGPLGTRAVSVGQYQIFVNEEIEPNSRLPSQSSNKLDFNYGNAALRRPRDPKTGRFLELPDSAFQYDISQAEGWVEMWPGQEISRELQLTADSNKAWKELLMPGGPYFLRYAPSGTVGNANGIFRWKFGTLKEWEGRKGDTRDDEARWMPITVRSDGAAMKVFVTDQDS